MRLRLLARAASLAVLVLLSGCFASQAPLITPASADTPIPAGATLTEYFNCASEAGKLLGCTGYQFRSNAKAALKDGVYTIHPEATPALAAQFPGGKVQDLNFMLKKVAPDAYVLQLAFDGAATAAPADSGPGIAGPSGVNMNYIYEFMQIKDGAAYFYMFSCEENGDKAYVRSGALTKISNALFAATCETASLDGLAKIFADRVANGAEADEKYEIKAPT